MITLHREQFPSANERWNKNDLEYLFHKTHQLLYEDFKNLALHKYFLEYRGIIEIEASNTYIVKSNDKVELHLENNERFRIGQMGEDYHNQYTLVKVFPDTEEPWEISKKNHSINERGL
ncbi:hypothetical protein [Chryseobacterium sp. 5_R23647]|uniref:hypothetical protein n=1 Tax=Chryseobacterium sp. 5_R23647 TaxID=2258964 RepID=UPI000E2540F3|nr:hypothetical protein [Chryseobacterium sp. 5_R23647]REC42020.1 hypothetical protein DRF69_12720 [Chryseobacterium sp. 5_R23647]